MRPFSRPALACASAIVLLVSLSPARLHAAAVDVIGGRTSVALDLAALESAGLTLSSVSDEVEAPGDIPDSVAFPINPRSAAPRPTSFSYDPADFINTFGGTIEHTGSVFFNDSAVEVGDFTIAFDAARAGTLNGSASGFYVQSNAGANAILFDVAAPDALDAQNDFLTIDADLLVSPEFAAVLQSLSGQTVDFSGADVGNARVAAAAIPLPPAVLPGLIGLASVAGLRFWRRRSAA